MRFLCYLLFVFGLSCASLGCSTTRPGANGVPNMAAIERQKPAALTTESRRTDEGEYDSLGSPRFVQVSPAQESETSSTVSSTVASDNASSRAHLNRPSSLKLVTVHLESDHGVVAETVRPAIATASLTKTQNSPTLEELISIAFSNNPAIKELVSTTNKAAGYQTQVGLYANPVLGYQGQQLADAGTDQHLAYLEQEIITGGKLHLNRSVLNEALRAQLQELEAQKLRVSTSIKMAGFECIQYQRQLAAIDNFSALLNRGVETAKQRMEAGEGSKIDVLQTQVQYQQLVLHRRQIAALLDAKLREIAALTGLPDMEIAGISGDLPSEALTLDWPSLEEELVASSPEYAAAQARIRQSSFAVQRNEIQPLPNIAVQLAAGVDNGTNSGMMNVQVGVPFPLYNKNQGNIAAARAEYCRAVHEAQRIDNAIRARLARVSGEYSRAALALNMYTNELLPAAEETLELTEKAYQAGEQDFIQLLVSRRTYFDTNLAYITSQAELAIAQSQIDGYLLSGALNSVIDGSGDDSLRGLTFSQQ